MHQGRMEQNRLDQRFFVAVCILIIAAMLLEGTLWSEGSEGLDLIILNGGKLGDSNTDTDTNKQGEDSVDRGKHHVAVCYVGHLRSYVHPIVRNSHRENFLDVLEKADFQLSLFVGIAAGDCFRSRHCSDISKVKQSDFQASVRRIFGRNDTNNLNEYDITIVPDKGPIPDPYTIAHKKCPDHGSQWYGWGTWFQWKRIGHCFEAIKEYEQERGIRFSAIIKLRPDIYFTAPSNVINFQKLVMANHDASLKKVINSSSDNNEGRLLLASGEGVNNGEYNDWVQACVGPGACEAFFTLVDRWQSCDEVPMEDGKLKKFCCVGLSGSRWMSLAWNAWRPRFAISEDNGLFPVTIARGGGGIPPNMIENVVEGNSTLWPHINLECDRLQKFIDLKEKCERDNKNVFVKVGL